MASPAPDYPDGLTGSKPVSPPHPRCDEDEGTPDPPGEEHAASPAGLPLLSFIPLLPLSPTTSLSLSELLRAG